MKLTKLKEFLIKHRASIVYWIVFCTIAIYFAPKQLHYYLDDEVDKFERSSFVPFLFWAGAIISITLLVFLIRNQKSFLNIVPSFFSGLFIIASIQFLFYNVFLGITLFLNRLYKHETVKKEFVVNYVYGFDKSKKYFFPYDVSNENISSDKKLRNNLYVPGLKQNDTVMLVFYKGLFGVEFYPDFLNDD